MRGAGDPLHAAVHVVSQACEMRSRPGARTSPQGTRLGMVHAASAKHLHHLHGAICSRYESHPRPAGVASSLHAHDVLELHVPLSRRA